MIDSVIDQYVEEIREMTPAQQKSKQASWENIEEVQQMTQIEFSEEVIERFWGYKKGTTPEIPASKKLSLGRGVWYTVLDPENKARNSLTIEPDGVDLVIIGIDHTAISRIEPNDEPIAIKRRNVCAAAS